MDQTRSPAFSFRSSLAVFCALALFPFSRLLKCQSKPVNLDELLKKTWEYCVRLDQVALYFTCTEEVSEKIYQPYRDMAWGRGWRLDQNDFVYDYQLIHRDARITERRILLKENGKPHRVEDASLGTERINYKTLVYGPNGILGPMAQLNNTYSIDGPDKIWGRPAIIVRVVPLHPEEAHWLYGRAWLNPADGSVFKIEWEEKSIGNYEEALALARKLNARPVISFATEYRYEKNGIRFPSLYRIVEDYQQPFGTARRLRKSELEVRCRDYMFFTVEVEIRGLE
jgi:hypothetical protein